MKQKIKESLYSVLIIDKQHIIGFDLQQTLKEQISEVTFESDLDSALVFIENKHPDFIIAETAAAKEILKKQKPGSTIDNSFYKGENSMLVITGDFKVIASFEKPFHSKLLAEFISGYNK